MKRFAVLLLGLYAMIQFAALVPPPATAVECNLAVNVNNPICVGGGCYKMEWTGNGTRFDLHRRPLGSGGPYITIPNVTSPYIDCPPATSVRGQEYRVAMYCNGRWYYGPWQGRSCD